MIEIDIWLLIRLFLTIFSAVIFYKIYKISRWDGFLFFFVCQTVNLFNRLFLLLNLFEPEPLNTIFLMTSVIVTLFGSYTIYTEFEKIFNESTKVYPKDEQILIQNITAAEEKLSEARIALRLARKLLVDKNNETNNKKNNGINHKL